MPISRTSRLTPPSIRTAAVLAAVLLSSALTGCSAPSATPEAAGDPIQAGTRPASPAAAAGDPLEAESLAVMTWQDRWYDAFCGAVPVAMGDQSCVGLALEAIAFVGEAPGRIADHIPADESGAALLAAADDARAAAAAVIDAGCDQVQTDACVTPVGDFTDAFRAYGDAVAAAVAAR